MSSLKAKTSFALALGLSALGTASFADVTAEQVWEDWRSYMEASGYTVSGSESRSGDTLQVTDLSMTVAIPEEDTSITLTMSELSFTENGDGTVSIAFPAELPLGMLVDEPGSDDVDVGMTYSTKGMSIVASGSPEEMVYTYSAAAVGLSVDEITVEGATIDFSTIGTVELNVANIAGSSVSSGRTLRTTEQKITSGAVSYLVDVTDPESGEGRLVLKGGADGMDSNASVAFPSEGDMNDMAQMLADGFSVDAVLSLVGGNLDFNFQENGETVQGSSSSSSSGLSVSMDADHLAYAVSSAGLSVMMAGGDIPFPVEMSMEEAGFALELPVSASDQEQEFAMATVLGDFVMSDLIWGIFDPAGQLPRDPATIALDLSGTAKLFFDLLDPAQMAAIDSGDEMPGEINSLSINELVLSLAGAELTGDGAFTFDNTDLSTFDGVPAPTGQLNLSLVGGNALLDTLVAMGLVPEDQAMGARMMMGLFAVPGDAPDTLNSTIEVKGDGQILANGQRIQ